MGRSAPRSRRGSPSRGVSPTTSPVFLRGGFSHAPSHASGQSSDSLKHNNGGMWQPQAWPLASRLSSSKPAHICSWRWGCRSSTEEGSPALGLDFRISSSWPGGARPRPQSCSRRLSCRPESSWPKVCICSPRPQRAPACCFCLGFDIGPPRAGNHRSRSRALPLERPDSLSCGCFCRTPFDRSSEIS